MWSIIVNFVAQVLVVNLLIAMMTETYHRIKDSAYNNWRFHRVGVVDESSASGFPLPPPLSIGHTLHHRHARVQYTLYTLYTHSHACTATHAHVHMNMGMAYQARAPLFALPPLAAERRE